MTPLSSPRNTIVHCEYLNNPDLDADVVHLALAKCRYRVPLALATCNPDG